MKLWIIWSQKRNYLVHGMIGDGEKWPLQATALFLDALQTALYRDKPTRKDNTLSATYQKLLDEPLGLEYGPDSLDEEYL